MENITDNQKKWRLLSLYNEFLNEMQLAEWLEA